MDLHGKTFFVIPMVNDRIPWYLPSMNTTLAKQSALEALGHLACRRHEWPAFQKEPCLTWGAPRQEGFKRLQRCTGVLRRPVHVAVPRVEHRRNLRSATVHVNRHLGLPGTVWALNEVVSIVSPAFCLAQFANETALPHLVELACALTGLYRFAPSHTGSILDAVPLTTCDEMAAVFAKYPAMYGARKARAAAQLAIDRLGSPYETILYLLLCLPRSMGGFGLPKPTANAEIVPNRAERHLVSQDRYYPDLFWPEAGLIVEYDSMERHSAPERAASDSRRRNDLELLGYAVVVITRPIIADECLFDKAVEHIRRELALSRWRDTAKFQAKRRELRHSLLVSPAPITGYWR